jgi:hypothetical protein
MKLTRRKLLSGVAALPILASVGKSEDYLHPGNISTGWTRMKFGAGGTLSRGDIAPDGTTVAGADNYGAYYYDKTAPSSGNTGGFGEWRQLVTSTSLGIAWDYPSLGAYGCYDITIAYSQTTRFYMMTDGYMWRSDNRGVSWTKLTGFARSQAAANFANGPYRSSGNFIAVDPVNPDVVFVTTTDNGVQYSTNAGVTWTTVSTSAIPAASRYYTVAFDPTSSSGGNTKGVYIGSYGNGIYHTSDYTGGSWALTTSSPAAFAMLVFDANGIGWMNDDRVGNSIGSIWKFSAGSWGKKYDQAVLGNNPFWVAVDPANTAHIFVSTLNNSTGYLYSGDGGATWSGGNQTVTPNSDDIPWLVKTLSVLGFGRIKFDPTQANTLINWSGLCVCKQNPPASGATNFTRTSISSGIDELTTNWAVHPPSGKFVAAFYDRPIFGVTPKTRGADALYPSDYFPTGLFNIAWSCDYAAGMNTVVALLSWNSTTPFDQSGVSQDGGATWTKFATSPPILGVNGGSWGGNIAASANLTSNYVMIRTENGSNPLLPYYTTNSGATWTASTFNGAQIPATSAPTGWSGSFSQLQQLLCADRVDTGTFYLVNSSVTALGGGLWKSTDGGANFSRVVTGAGITGGVLGRIQAVPGNAGHLFLTVGGSINPADGNFRRSTDHGATWRDVTNVTHVWCFGFGPIKTGQTYPSIAFFGQYKGAYGFYRTVDNFATVQLLSLNPGDRLDLPICVVPDPDVFGVYRFGWKGTSFVQGYFP